MYSAGNILYFNPFYFKNGNNSKPKCFIVLFNNQTNTILASLPTSKDSVPTFIELKHGCINLENINFNCYYFEANKKITTNNWAFERPTFVYGAQVESYELSILIEDYQIKNIDYKIIGSLKKDEFKNLIECFISSSSLKRKFKPLLKTQLQGF